MAVLLSFPDCGDKANRRARARLGMSAGSADGYVQLIERLCHTYPEPVPGEASGDWKQRLHRWADGANRLLFEIARRPVQVRADTRLLDRLLKLKGLVSEAEAECLSDMGASRNGRGTSDCFGMAHEVDDDLRTRLESAEAGARRAPPAAALTPDLLSAVAAPAEGMLRPDGAGYPSGRSIVSDNLVLHGSTHTAGRGVAGMEVAPLRGRMSATAPSGLQRLARLFHALKMQLLRRAVSEKENRGFSRRPGVRS